MHMLSSLPAHFLNTSSEVPACSMPIEENTKEEGQQAVATWRGKQNHPAWVIDDAEGNGTCMSL